RHAIESSILSLKRSDHLPRILQRPIIGRSKNTLKLHCIFLAGSKCRTSSSNLPTFDTSERRGTDFGYLLIVSLYRRLLLLEFSALGLSLFIRNVPSSLSLNVLIL